MSRRPETQAQPLARLNAVDAWSFWLWRFSSFSTMNFGMEFRINALAISWMNYHEVFYVAYL